MPTVLNGVTTTLVMLFKGIPALNGVSVEDTDYISSTGWTEAVIVGDDGDPDSDVQSTFTQEWADLVHSRRSETGEIPCAVIAQSGSTDIAARRTRMSEILAECEAVIIANPTLGGIVFTTEVILGATKPVQNEKGSAIVAPFTVRYWAHV